MTKSAALSISDECSTAFASTCAANRPPSIAKLTNKFMKTQILQVFDPAMCCSTGACGPDVDTKLVQFAADLDWLKSQGVIVQRHNLSQNPAAFVENNTVQASLTEKGEAALPVLLVHGNVATTGRYPDRAELASLLNLKATAAPAPAKSSCCCGGSC
jgi:Arsenical resistance operon protein ArsD